MFFPPKIDHFCPTCFKMILFVKAEYEKDDNKLTSIIGKFLEKLSKRENIKEMFCFDLVLSSIIVFQEGFCSFFFL